MRRTFVQATLQATLPAFLSLLALTSPATGQGPVPGLYVRAYWPGPAIATGKWRRPR